MQNSYSCYKKIDPNNGFLMLCFTGKKRQTARQIYCRCIRQMKERKKTQNSKEIAREDFLVILVGSQMCQSRCHEILVTAPEMRERFVSLNSLLLNWSVLEICNVLCTSHCVVFMMFPLSWDRSLGRCFQPAGKMN